MFPRGLLGGALFLFSLPFAAHAQVALDRPGQFTSPPPRLADGFDFPIGKPDARGYYKARGFNTTGHPGEDWDGIGGGDSDFNDPVSSIGDGEVIFASDAHRGWGNVVIIRHQFREKGAMKTINVLLGHLNAILVRPGEFVRRGEQIGTVGTGHGHYDAHLHLEIRKNLAIGTDRAAFPCDLTCYYDPSAFILAHRPAPVAAAANEVILGVSRDLERPNQPAIRPSRIKFTPPAALAY